MARQDYNAVDSSNNQLDQSILYGGEKDSDYELSYNYTLAKLRKISSKLVKNNPVASALQLATINSVIGGHIAIKIMNKDLSKNVETTKRLNIILEGVDKDREMSLDEMTEILVSSSFEKGDILINIPYDKVQDIGTYVNLIEASRIETPPCFINDDSIREGVKYSNGRVIGYYVRKLVTNPSSPIKNRYSKEEYTYLPKYYVTNGRKRKVCHLFKAPFNVRPEQSRGVPSLTPVMDMLRYFTDYLETIIIQARVSASFCAFISSSNPAGSKNAIEGGSTVEGVGKIKPGTIFYMKRGDRVDFASPTRPSDNTDQFLKRILRIIVSAYRYPYELVFYDLSETNYSSLKGASIEFKRVVQRWHRHLETVIKWVVGTFLDEMSLRGLSSGRVDSVIKVNFPTFGILDEEKKARADKISVKSTGSKSVQDVCDEEDREYEVLIGERKEEALDDLDIQTAVLIKQKENSKKFDIVYPDSAEAEEGSRDTSGSRRAGESKSGDLDSDDAKERRATDGNN